MRRATVLVLAACCALLLQMPAQGAPPLLKARFLGMPLEEAEKGNEICVSGVVTYVFPGSGGDFVLADVDHPNGFGLYVRNAVAEVSVGDVVTVAGVTCVENYRAAVRALSVAVSGSVELPSAPAIRYSDFRKGWGYLRRYAPVGLVLSSYREGEDTVVWLELGGSQRVNVHVHGEFDNRLLREGSQVLVRGVGYYTSDAEGGIHDIHLDVASSDDFRPFGETPSDGWRFVAIGAGAVLAVVLLFLCVMWMRVRKERAKERLVAAERRRIAAELHDTVEQHLATAKLYLSAAMKAGELPERTAFALKMVENVLVHAKVEVRDSVMELRGETNRGAKDSMATLARQISAGGEVKVRTRLGALPGDFGGARGNDLVAIVREAVTNAIKHGKAKNIAIVADAVDRGFVLQVLNDGEKFDAAKAFGPEAGHYGLSGMKERAARSHFALSFVYDGKWCGVKLTNTER